ncbi:glycosyl hydrolase family 28-related protein [Luteolibacter soli]|uniref:Glycosyl hydrolase family 28-related protein n=1 Tax=Luteolibacter soli TaxID=3135280 RepID=A0ABU9B082_9BACT
MPSHIIRILCEARSQSRTVRDAATQEAPFAWRGSDLAFQLALTDNGQHLLAAGVGTIIVEVKSLNATSADDSLMRKEFDADDCDETFVAGDWAGGAKQLLAATFTKAEAALAQDSYRFIVRHVADDGSEMTYISAEFRLLDPQSGSEGLDAPPVAWSYLEGLPVIRPDIPQSLTGGQKEQALANLGLPSADVTLASISAMSAAQAAQAAIDLGAAISVKAFGAAGDAKAIFVASMTSGSAVLSSGYAGFSAGDVGKYIRVEKAGAASADLITTIASYQNSGQVTLAVAAGSSVANTAAFWGTNDTAAVQAAIDAAVASDKIQTVCFPQGRYLCNVTVGINTHLVGMGQGGVVGLIHGANNSNFTDSPAVLFPAVRTSPVVYFTSAFGAAMRNLKVSGSNTAMGGKVGTGVQIGDPATGANDWVGNGFVMDQVQILGFKYDLVSNRTANHLINGCTFGFCDYGIYFSEIGVGPNGATANHLISASYFDHCSVTAIYGLSCKDLTVIGVDATFCEKFADLYQVSSLVIVAMNMEQSTGASFVDLSGASSLVVDRATFVNANFIVRRMDSSSQGNVVINSSDASAFYYTGGLEYPAMQSGYICRFIDYTFATRSQLEHVVQQNRSETINEHLGHGLIFHEPWIRSRGTSPYGNNGWTITNIAGGYLVRGSVTGGNNVEFYSTTSGGSEQARLMLEAAMFWFGNTYEMAIEMACPWAPASGIFRAGLYSRDSTADMTPDHGIGLKLDRSVPDANLKMEFRNGGTVSEVDTGIPYTSLTTQMKFTLQRTFTGFSVVARNAGTGAIVAPQVHLACTPGGAFVSPGVFSAVSSAQPGQVNLFTFKVRSHPGPSEFVWVP